MKPVISHISVNNEDPRCKSCQIILYQMVDESFMLKYGPKVNKNLDYAQAALLVGNAVMHAALVTGKIRYTNMRVNEEIEQHVVRTGMYIVGGGIGEDVS